MKVCSACGSALRTEARYMPKARKVVNVTVCKRITCKMYRAVQEGVRPA